MKAILKHELLMYYNSMTAYVFSAFLLLFVGIGAVIYNINASLANFEYVLAFIALIFVIIVPILTMRVMSEERKQKTDQLLYSLPISTGGMVIGKFLALLVVYLVPCVVMCVYPLIFAAYGDVYLPTSYGSICAFFFLGLTLISIGMFISSLTESQAVAAGVTLAAVLFLYYSTTLADYVSATSLGSLISILVILVLAGCLVKFLTKSNIVAIVIAGILIIICLVIYFANPNLFEGLLPNIMEQISPFERFYIFVNGIFDLTAIIYYISVICLFLFFTVQSFEKRRYN